MQASEACDAGSIPAGRTSYTLGIEQKKSPWDDFLVTSYKSVYQNIELKNISFNIMNYIFLFNYFDIIIMSPCNPRNKNEDQGENGDDFIDCFHGYGDSVLSFKY